MLNPMLRSLNALVPCISLGAIAVILPSRPAPAMTPSPIQTPSFDVPLVSQGISPKVSPRDPLGDASPLASVLTSVSWQLRRWNRTPLNPELPPIHLELDSDTVRGSSGCNTYFGNLDNSPLDDHQGQHIGFDAIASSRRACEPPIMERETQYLQSLAGVRKYSLDRNGNLWLAYQTASGTGTLEFSPR
jgi:heat shock protein HslJ